MNRAESYFWVVADELVRQYPLMSKTLDYIEKNFDHGFYIFASKVLRDSFQGDSNRVTLAIKSFAKYTNEYLFLQHKLQKTGKYLNSSYKDVEASVYMSEQSMAYYLDGLLLSQFFWPNHYKIIDFLRQTVAGKKFKYILDAPCGTGLQSFVLRSELVFTEFTSLDLSPFSVSFAKQLNDKLGGLASCNFEQKSIYDVVGSYDFICCGELLEHLEEPELLLEKLHDLLSDEGEIFLTTAIFAAAIDHIYLFRTVQEVRDMLNKHFRIISELILPVSLTPFSDDMVDVPINYACVLRK